MSECAQYRVVEAERTTCPFCGSEHTGFVAVPPWKDEAGNRTGFRSVACVNCWAHGPRATTDEEAVQGWNASAKANGWQEFGKTPLSGVYWVRGVRPEYDIDADDCGRTVGVPTGESGEFVSLVEIEFDPAPDGEFEVNPVNRYETGDFDDDHGITHYMRFAMPVFPSDGLQEGDH